MLRDFDMKQRCASVRIIYLMKVPTAMYPFVTHDPNMFKLKTLLDLEIKSVSSEGKLQNSW